METMRSSNIKENCSLLGHPPQVIGSHLHIMNIKSRFKKPITSKTINRMFTPRWRLNGPAEELRRASTDMRLSVGRTL